MAKRVNHHRFSVSSIFENLVHFETGFRCDWFVADRAEVLLIAPEFEQFFSALGAV